MTSEPGSPSRAADQLGGPGARADPRRAL